MARTERLEARVAPADAERIRRAAEATRVSVGAFVVDAARAKADEVLARRNETVVPAEYYERLLEELDKPPEVLPRLAKAVGRARRHPVTRR